jgi:acyl CoA:acetate/3-ketoacid CoA transferase
MRPAKVRTAAEAAALVPDGAVVTVSSSSALGCPDEVLRALGERFAAEGSPGGLVMLHPIAAGDMYGVKGIDHLARPGMIRRVVAGSYPSGPSRSEPPLIWQLIERNEVEAYNLPSGVLFQMHRAAAARQPGVLSAVGLDTYVDPRHEGGAMNDVTPRDLVRLEHVDGREWLRYPALVPDVAIIRATTADEHGNLTYEEEASTLGALDQALAAHNHGGVVIAQVKRLATSRSIYPQNVRVPGILVDAVVVAPDQWQTTQTPYDPALAGRERRPLSDIEPLPHGIDAVIAARAAQEVGDGEIVNLGFGISALVPRVLLAQGRADSVTWVLEQGPVGGVPLTGFAFGCAINAEAFMTSADQFTLLAGGGMHRALLSFLEVDEEGNVNVHHLPRRRHVTAGVGGFADITSAAPALVFSGHFTAGSRRLHVGGGRLTIEVDGPVPKFVKRVSAVTFSGRRARATGQSVRYVTDRCVIELRDQGLVVVEIAPGVDVERDVLGRSEARLTVADDLRTMPTHLFDAPSGPDPAVPGIAGATP